MKLEVCVDDADSLNAAIAGGADRIELCSALELGGLTPSPGLVAIAGKTNVAVFAMIRPNAGGFQLSKADIAVMLHDMQAMRNAGLAGVVFGASLANFELDQDALATLMQGASGLETTLHRAFDLVPDQPRALEAAIALGFGRILTSGGAATAPKGARALAKLHAQANGRIGLLPGSGISATSVEKVLNAAPFREIHASCSHPKPQNPILQDAGFEGPIGRICDADLVRALKAKIAPI